LIFGSGIEDEVPVRIHGELTVSLDHALEHVRMIAHDNRRAGGEERVEECFVGTRRAARTLDAGVDHHHDGIGDLASLAHDRRRELRIAPVGLSGGRGTGECRVERNVAVETQEADADSHNVMGEIRGREKPDEVVVLGGHIDSWDVGQGAMDDGGGSVAAWEAVRLIKQLGLKPRRTIRVVLWTNEENGSRGALAYRDTHANELNKHVMAMESDNGVFKPLGYRISAPDSAVTIARDIASLLSGIGASSVAPGGSEADVEPLLERGVPVVDLAVEGTRYFWYHHSEADTIDKLNPRDVAECVALMAVMAYVVADMPGTLGRAATH